jgi:eukaryotic-like serine/threonine-protein kinase
MCPDEERILLLLDGELPDDARAEIEAHVDTCGACRRLLALAVPAGETGAADDVARRAPYLESGAVLSRYVILGAVGAGGMGVVYAAYDPELDRRVAVKVLWSHGEDEERERRVLREAQAMARLTHPNVVAVHDVGMVDGRVFIVMEFVQGATLRRWLEAPQRPAGEVLDVFRRAGAGLAAAHAEGLVHRDFKPDNVLIGEDGRVLVTDFGLARVAGDTEGVGVEPISGAEPSGDRITSTGVVAGTPAYMAPEQLDGAEVDPRSDVFSFCASLHEALYGERPFPGVTAKEIREAISRGLDREPAGSARVPAWVRRIVAQGLSVDPGERPRSMAELVEALGRDPAARGRVRRRRVAVGAAAVLVLAVAAAGWVRSGAFRDPCAHPERQLAGAWDARVEARVRAAFAGTGRPYAGDTAGRVVALLDRYGAGWAAMRGEVCEASRGERGPRDVAGLRDACLERRRTELGALTAVLAGAPDTEVLDRAVASAMSLPAVADCADVAALTARVRPPEGPGLRAQVAALAPRAAQVDAMLAAGKYREGLALAEPLFTEAKAVAYPPLAAQVASAVGGLRAQLDDYEGAKAALREAAALAAEGDDDLRTASVWTNLLLVVGDHERRLEEASIIRALGPPAIARAHDPHSLAHWLSTEAAYLVRAGKYPEALSALERALSICEQTLPPDHVNIAEALAEMARVHTAMGDYPQARALFERALAIEEKAVGPEHPTFAAMLTNLGNVLIGMGAFREARAVFERSVAIQERSLGPDNISLAISLDNLGCVLRDLGDAKGALALEERALAIAEKAVGPDHPIVSGMLTNMANVYFTRSEWARAKVVLERAIAIDDKTLGPDNPDRAAPIMNLGGALSAMNDFEGAVRMHERALALQEKKLGEQHPKVILNLVEIGRDRVELHQLDAALAVLERAHALAEKGQAISPSVRAAPLLGLGELYLARHDPARAVAVLEQGLAIGEGAHEGEFQLALADALWALGKDRARARSLAEQARAGAQRAGLRAQAAEAAQWLAEHRVP